jgi:DNA gyrase/topoisomerase IV subunit A
MQTLALTQWSMYQIKQDHVILMQIIEDNEGEITPEIETALQLTSDNFQEKALSYGLVVKHFDDQAEIIEKEIERLSKILTQAKKRKELFKQTLSDAMQQFGVEKIETPTLKLSFRKSESIELTDESKVPFAYVEEKVVKTISKTKIKEDIKQGLQVPGAQLVTKQNLQIK